ncbi:MAG: DUF3127 domain-containing protein [Bacteroidetes bacterium]|nr:DUF3127 domain-containing protein [Bacteroidota bacterium]MBV6461733.1 hypothetical protein [Flavobacteriales bacterium]WKZ75136.1 MAG: DUF3127 domain-containing protein [Vicingaceae bacterium]MCL4815518.1 DUF3127 domain-containing protein [Flavobacteriales bacterium]NOG95952.1 DUF3127 domain-containing protein [Bacteroidota bacterium]
MEITAKLIQLLPLQTGMGKNGEWKKQEFIVETLGSQYPKKICISVWGDKINESVLKEGNELNVSFDVESREYNGRWYTDVKAWKVELAKQTSSNEKTTSQQAVESSFNSAPENSAEDDLPF